MTLLVARENAPAVIEGALALARAQARPTPPGRDAW